MSDPILGVKNFISAAFDTSNSSSKPQKAQTEMSPDAFYNNLIFHYGASSSSATAATNAQNVD